MLKAHLQEAFTAEELAQDLSHVERRVARRRVARRAAWVAAPLAALVALAAGWTLAGNGESSEALAGVAPGEGSPGDPDDAPATLAMQGGAPMVASLERGESAFSDGSTVTLEPGGVLRASAATDTVAFTLEGGRARFDIVPGGPRRWSVAAGAVQVVVLGTSFTVERDGASVTVTVHRGVVQVQASGQARRLLAGERFSTGPEATGPEPAASADEADGDEVQPPVPEGAGAEDPSVAQASRTEPRPTRAPSAAELLERSDRARREGDLDAAAAALEALITRHASAPEAASAAASLGRLEQGRGRLPAAAAAFERALALHPPPALAELCYERLVSVALARGSRSEAERWAAAHRRAFPQASRRASIDALLDAP